MILTFALGHEQLPASYSLAARPALDRLEAELPPEQLASARVAAAAASLEDLVGRPSSQSPNAPAPTAEGIVHT